MTDQTDPAAMVKALVWGYHPAGTIAAPPTGHSYIIDTRMKGRCYSIKGFYPPREFESIEAAKAAAQADYEARILSALTVIDAKALVKAALERAAEEVSVGMCDEPSAINTALRMARRDIRALADDPEAVAEIIERAKGESDG